MAVIGAALSLANRGHQVTVFIFGQSQNSVFTNKDYYEKLKSKNIEVIIAKSWKTRAYGGLGSISDVINLFKKVTSNDIVSMHQVYNFQNILCAFLCLVAKTPYTIMPHGTLTKYQKRKHVFRKIFVHHLFVVLLLKRAKSIIVATQIEKDEINRSLNEKTIVVGLGVFIEEKIEKIAKYDSNENDFHFVFMSRIAPKKRLDIAIEAFYCLPEEIRLRSKLVICGSGDSAYIKTMLKKVRNNSLVDRVDFKGWVSAEEKFEVLTRANCFVLTSEDENFAIAVGEALAFGVPCILSRQVALSSLVEKYEAGKVFFELQPSNISKLMHELFKSDKNEMRLRALRASKELNWEIVIIDWEIAFMKSIGILT